MKTRISAILLAAVLLLSLLPLTALAEETVLNDSNANSKDEVLDQGDTEHRVHWTLYKDGTLTLKPNDRYGYLEKNEQPWLDYDTQIHSLVIETSDYLTFIPERMFYKLPRLWNVTVNGSLKEIEESAFEGCAELITVAIHGNVGGYDGRACWGGVGDRAFKDCKNLEHFNVDGVIANIGYEAFSGCDLSRLDATVLGDIGASAFQNNTGLNHIPPIRGSVGNYAFKDTGLRGINVYIVSGHAGTLGSEAFKRTDVEDGSKVISYSNLCFTGTEAEFKNINKTGHSSDVYYQKIGDNVTWTLDENTGVLTISGSGSTIDLLDWTEQPWVNIPGKGSYDDQRDAITRVIVNGSITFGAHMLEGLESRVEPPGSAEPPVSGPFADVSENDWFFADVGFVISGGYMRGTAADAFSPGLTMTRAMTVTILHRLAGAPAAADCSFADVSGGSWYAAAVNWAAETGLTAGVSETRFAPDAEVTREQLASFLFRYAANAGFSPQAGDLSAFPDAGSVSGWAADAMGWAVNAGIIQGTDAGLLEPRAGGSRAQFAAMLRRFVQWTEAQ